MLILAIRGVGIQNSHEREVAIYSKKPISFVHFLENVLLQVPQTRQEKFISVSYLSAWRIANYSEYK